MTSKPQSSPAPTWLSAAGLVATHEPLDGDARAAVLSLADWHDNARTDDWYFEPPSQFGGPGHTRARTAVVRTLGSINADLAIGAELAVGLAKSWRPVAKDPSSIPLGDVDDLLCDFASLFYGDSDAAQIGFSVFAEVSSLLAHLIASQGSRDTILARFDAIDHAEAAARLRSLADGFEPPWIFQATDRFPLLSRPGVWVVTPGGPRE